MKKAVSGTTVGGCCLYGRGCGAGSADDGARARDEHAGPERVIGNDGRKTPAECVRETNRETTTTTTHYSSYTNFPVDVFIFYRYCYLDDAARRDTTHCAVGPLLSLLLCVRAHNTRKEKEINTTARRRRNTVRRGGRIAMGERR